jgi:hypothetical protein
MNGGPRQGYVPGERGEGILRCAQDELDPLTLTLSLGGERG